jgi:hypothetical protein
MKAPLKLKCSQDPRFNHVIEDVLAKSTDDELMNFAKN